MRFFAVERIIHGQPERLTVLALNGAEASRVADDAKALAEQPSAKVRARWAKNAGRLTHRPFSALVVVEAS